MAEKREKFGRSFKLKERQAEELHLSTSPERSGPDKVKTADLSFDFKMKGAEIAKLDRGMASLWTDGTPSIESLKRPIYLAAVFKGTATIGSVRAVGAAYPAKFCDFKVTPAIDGELEVRARFHLAVTDETDELYNLVIAGVCKIAFEGKLLIAAKGDEDDGDQEDLPL